MSDPFNTREHVPDFEAVVAGYRLRSQQTRAAHRTQPDVPYGDGADERLDLFFPDPLSTPAPIHVFVHGGYWRANRKEDYAFVAEPVLAAGGIAAIVEYSLMPSARMDHLVGQVRRAATWVAENAARIGGDPARLSASGHSAGAHLAFYMVAKGPHEADFPATRVSRLLLVSGLYDLEPISRSFLQAEIGLTSDEVARWSPVGADFPEAVEAHALVGAAETAPFHEQAGRLSRRHGIGVTTLASLDHMTIARDLGTPGAAAADILRIVAGQEHAPACGSGARRAFVSNDGLGGAFGGCHPHCDPE